MIKEEFPANKYTIYASKQSVFDTSYTHTLEIGLICPACKVGGSLIEHGKSRTCQCGVRLTVWGNCLEVSKGWQ